VNYLKEQKNFDNEWDLEIKNFRDFKEDRGF